MANVESLELKITGDAKSAQKSIDALIATLDKLKKATADACGLDKVSKEMGNVSDKMSKIKSLNLGLSASTNKSAKSFSLFSSKALAGAFSLHKITDAVGSWISKSNEYVENLNLFTVSMGEYASEAQEYAETVGEAMGIDPSTWMRNQGVFMTLSTGFGVVGDRAATMSQQLTQLGYDLSSFFNISVEDAMQKLQSGLAGELEPLRRLGYDLSKAKLEAIALSQGIDKTFDSMTQAEKAQLRYYAIMTQVTTAQGDMARTLQSPSNQLRVFKAQLEVTARALGNIFIPALNAILPYAIAAVRVIRDLANAIASLFGYELPSVDYSGVTAGASGASEALDTATGSAKKLKKALLGIDELNVLSDPSGGGAGASAGGGSGFDFDLPTYDFMADINKNADKAYKTLRKILKPVESLLEMLLEYKEIVALGLGIVALVKLWGKLKVFWAWFKGLALVDAFLNGFSLIRVTGGTVFQSIRGGLDSVRYSLSTMAKAAIVAVAGFIEFDVVKDNIYDIAMGCDNVAGKIAGIAAVVAAAATAMYVALGPAGLAVAGVVAITAAVVGYREAQEQMLTDMNMAVFFDGVGVSIESLAGKLNLLTEEFNVQNGQIIEWADEIESNNETIDKVTSNIETLTATLGITGVVTQEEITEIKKQFASLYKAVKSNMSNSEEIIMTALVGALKRATPEISAQIDVLIGEYQRYVRETQGRAEELKLLIDNGYDQLVGKHKDDPAYQEIMGQIQGWYTELGYLNGSMSESGWQWQQTVADINANGVDFGGSVDEAKEKIDEVTGVAQTALEDIRAARDTVMMEIDNAIAYASKYGTDEEVQLLGDIKQVLANDYAAQEQAITDELQAIFDTIQTQMVEKATESNQKAKDAWEDKSWIGKWWSGGNKATYVQDALKNYQTKIVDPLNDHIEESFETLKADGSAWASDAMTGILDEFFDVRVGSNGDTNGYVYRAGTTLRGCIDEMFADLEMSGVKSAGAAGESIIDGLEGSISDGADAVADAGAEVVGDLDDAVRETAEINSPSKLFAREGGYMMDGLIQGVGDKENDLKTAVASAIDSTFSTKTAKSYGESFGKSLADAMVKTIKNTTFPKLKGTVSTSSDGTASIKFKAYAAGGFPTEGEVFVARENGPEMVASIGNRTAVANNDQIVESVSKGVYQAVASAMGQSGGTKVVEAKVNDKVLFEVVVDQNRRETMRTGYSPLLGGV